MANARHHGRRDFFALATAGFLSAPALAFGKQPEQRRLAFHHLHTGESLDVVYWADGRYLPDATSRIDRLLRDFRADKVHAINLKLLDLLVALRYRLQVEAPYHVIGGYRCPATNAMLREETTGVAANSLHMAGSAIDLCVPGTALAAVYRTALAMKAGGVGYYPRSNFVHVDVGPVRHW